MGDFKLLIDGKMVVGEGELDVINPATEEVFATCSRASKAQLDQAVEAAGRAFVSWSRTPIEERRAKLIQVADIAAAHAEELGQILTREQGKPLKDAIAEIYGFSVFTRRFAEMDLPVEVLEDSETRRVEAHRVPLGVIGAIVPWNFPIVLLGFKFAPSLLAGNTLVVKPAPTTPLTTLRLAELIREVFAPGVVNVLADASDLGPLITAHPGIRKVSFTGSTATGAKVMEGAAGTLKRVTLELGGNDAGLVLGDVDPKVVAPKLFQAAFGNCGQICIAMKRLYAEDSIYDALCDELVEIAKATSVGDGLDESSMLGPLQNKAQFEKVKGLIEEAASQGKIIAGGNVPDRPGYFIEPTLVRDIEEGTRLVDEEQFGPVLPIIRFSDADEALERINRCDQGLGGSIWSEDLEKAGRLARSLEAGTVWINKHGELDPAIPFGGSKLSGLGTELGRAGLEEFTQLKVINIGR